MGTPHAPDAAVSGPVAARYSLNAAIAVSPLFTVTLFDLLAPLEGRQSTV